MITLELKRLSPDFLPDDPDNCCVNMVASVGQKSNEGADNFYFTVVTPTFLSKNWPFWGKNTLIVESYCFDIIKKSVVVLLEECSRPSWSEAATALNNYMGWEFNNYESCKA